MGKQQDKSQKVKKYEQKSKYKSQQKSKAFLNDNYYLLPLLFVLVIVPLIVKAHAYDTGLTEYAWGAGNTEPDFFLFWKGR